MKIGAKVGANESRCVRCITSSATAESARDPIPNLKVKKKCDTRNKATSAHGLGISLEGSHISVSRGGWEREGS